MFIRSSWSKVKTKVSTMGCYCFLFLFVLSLFLLFIIVIMYFRRWKQHERHIKTIMLNNYDYMLLTYARKPLEPSVKRHIYYL